MKSRRCSGLIATLVLSLPGLAFGDDIQGDRRDTPFIGVFYPIVTGFAIDAQRCPDPSHPILLSFSGSAQTTLGRAEFTQSHCEDSAHTSFRRGVQTITFDNGWQLFGTYRGQLFVTPTTSLDAKLIIGGHYRNAGGTGPLATANGGGISAGTVDANTGAAVVTVSGTL